MITKENQEAFLKSNFNIVVGRKYYIVTSNDDSYGTLSLKTIVHSHFKLWKDKIL